MVTLRQHLTKEVTSLNNSAVTVTGFDNNRSGESCACTYVQVQPLGSSYYYFSPCLHFFLHRISESVHLLMLKLLDHVSHQN